MSLQKVLLPDFHLHLEGKRSLFRPHREAKGRFSCIIEVNDTFLSRNNLVREQFLGQKDAHLPTGEIRNPMAPLS
jgi:hypothetical protein